MHGFESTKEDGKPHHFLTELGKDVIKIEIYKPISRIKIFPKTEIKY